MLLLRWRRLPARCPGWYLCPVSRLVQVVTVKKFATLSFQAAAVVVITIWAMLITFILLFVRIFTVVQPDFILEMSYMLF